MKSKRAHILLPHDLVKEIDSIVGPRGRSAFLVETAREAIRRRKLLRFLESDTPAWKDADHPELGRGAAAWVRELWQENERKRTKKQRRAHVNRKYFILEKDGIPVAGVLSADELEDYLEMQEPGLKAQIRKSNEEYRRGKGRDAGIFLADLQRAASRPKR